MATLAQYLSNAVSAAALRAGPKAYLGRVDLGQSPNGPLVRCPDDEQIEVTDAAGKSLGTIGFCGTHARFDAPDKICGGITAPLPP